MKRKFLEDMGLEKEQIDQILDENSQDIGKAKGDLDEAKKEIETLKGQLADRDGQLETLKNSTGDVDAMKKQIETLQNENKAKDEAHAAEIKQLKIDSALDIALGNAKARNMVAVKALLKDMDKAELDADGSIKGLADQIAALQKSDSYLFDTTSKKTQVKGAEPGESGNDDGDGMSIEQLRKMSPADRHTYSITNPEQYKKLYERGI